MCSVFIVTDEVVRLRLIAASGSFVIRLRLRVRVARVLLEHDANASVVTIDLQMTFCTTPVCDFPLDFDKLNVLHARARLVLGSSVAVVVVTVVLRSVGLVIVTG